MVKRKIPKELPISGRQTARILALIPLIGVTSFVLYKRLVLGEPQRTFYDSKVDTVTQSGNIDEKQ
ncbi:hypothetical protein IW261DRAFT_863478 [Armillaria novae-zelandiae]|uniref:Uncharacterized protein n=1 Tax=Armillaria novae-zelandiae TaxID=153914 RepID=A0AA39UJ48_9AGAR|nr:hypothetical protein IW261DRAFT_863478 [Armillaria novae-zelandiae]